MPRTATFDNQKVLDQAMQLFWRQGYHATSVRDVMQATGLKPGSLYAAFGGKRQLFQRVLERYHESTLEQIRGYLNSDRDPIDRIREVFERLLKRCREDSDGKGCLMSNTILELACVDSELASQANSMFREIEMELERVVKEAQTQGHIDNQRDPGFLARYIVTGIHGIRVYSKGNPKSENLDSIVEEMLSNIQSFSDRRNAFGLAPVN